MRQNPPQSAPQAAPVSPPPATKVAAAPLIIVPPLSLKLASRWDFQPALGVKRQMWRKDDDHAHLADAAFQPVRDTILKRDNYTCRFCNFKASKYQEVHHVDDNHSNNDQKNLLTVCNLCHQVFHLGMIGMRNAGVIAAIPELTQVEVNQIVRGHFVTQHIGDQNAKDKMTGLYAVLRSRADMLKEAFGRDISSPLLFAEIFSVADDALYAQRGKIMESLRILPTQQAFHPGQLEYYAVNNSTSFRTEGWAALARQFAG